MRFLIIAALTAFTSALVLPKDILSKIGVAKRSVVFGHYVVPVGSTGETPVEDDVTKKAKRSVVFGHYVVPVDSTGETPLDDDVTKKAKRTIK